MTYVGQSLTEGISAASEQQRAAIEQERLRKGQLDKLAQVAAIGGGALLLALMIAVAVRK